MEGAGACATLGVALPPACTANMGSTWRSDPNVPCQTSALAPVATLPASRSSGSVPLLEFMVIILGVMPKPFRVCATSIKRWASHSTGELFSSVRAAASFDWMSGRGGHPTHLRVAEHGVVERLQRVRARVDECVVA